MEENKSGSSKINTAVFVILFSIAVVFEFYWIMVYPDDYFMLFGIGIVALILGFLSAESILSHYRKIQKERFEQNEMLIKTQKALYLATKKSAASAEIKAEQNLEAIKYLVTKISENQKELTELIASSKKDSNEDSVSDIGGIVEQITRSNAKLAQEIQTAITVNELVKTNADLVKNVKEVLGQTLSSSSSLAASLSQVQNDVKPPVSFDTESENIDFNQVLPEVDSLDIEDDEYIENIPSFDSFENNDNETTDDTVVTNNTEMPDIAETAETYSEEFTNTVAVAETYSEEFTNTAAVAETYSEEIPDMVETAETNTKEITDTPEVAVTPQAPDTSDDVVESAIDDALNKFMSFDDNDESENSIPYTDETLSDEKSFDKDLSNETSPDEKSFDKDLSDDTTPNENVFSNVSDDDSSGNKMLSADEIAALFAKL